MVILVFFFTYFYLYKRVLNSRFPYESHIGVFYFAGHGFRMQESYMLPVDTPTNFLRKDSLSESLLHSMALKKDPALLVVIQDMCQTAPPA